MTRFALGLTMAWSPMNTVGCRVHRNQPGNNTWTPQTVPSGAHVTLQLPSDPIRWVPERGQDCQPSSVGGLVPTWLVPLRAKVELTGRSRLPNEGRMPGSSAISVFDYQVGGAGIAALCLRPESADTACPTTTFSLSWWVCRGSVSR